MSPDQSINQISSLIRLMDDRDEFVRSKVREQLIALGEDALPFLEIASNDENPQRRAMAREIIQAVLPKQLGGKFRRLVASARGGDLDLETGMGLISEFGYPGFDSENTRTLLDALAEELAKRLADSSSSLEVVQGMSRFMFHEKGYKGNKENYLDPDNSYIHCVFEQKLGIPITLSCLCVLMGQRLGLPIVGVGLPGHFIAKYDSIKDPVYFDPFNEGRILSKEDCVRIVKELGFRFEDHLLFRATHRETLIRMINNLILIYNQNQEPDKAEILSGYANILIQSPRSPSTNQPDSKTT